jgi:hypothetical protein
MQDAVLTRDNLKKRNWPGNLFFFDKNENRNHFFFTCILAKVVWGIIGAVFGKKTHLSEVSLAMFCLILCFLAWGKSLTLCLLVYMDDKEQNNV